MLEFYISLIFNEMKLSNRNQELVYYKPFLNNSKIENFANYKITTRSSISLPNFSYKGLFRYLSIENIFLILKYILLEKQIILFSSRPGNIASVTESLLSLILPLTWTCTYIPFAP